MQNLLVSHMNARLLVEKMDEKRPLSSVAFPIEGEAGKTGSWRTLRPVLKVEKCIAAKKGKLICLQCWIYCPEACISRTIPPKIDLDYCKGCSLCAEVCPSHAIEIIEESKAEEMEKDG